MTRISTTHRTFNKTLRKSLLNYFPTAKTLKKIHVAGIGYVNYIYDENKNKLGWVSKSVLNPFMEITVK